MKFHEILEAKLPLGGQSPSTTNFTFGFEAEFVVSEGYIRTIGERHIDELMSDENDPMGFLTEHFEMPDLDNALKEFADETSSDEEATAEIMLDTLGAQKFLKQVNANLIDDRQDSYDPDSGTFSTDDQGHVDVLYNVADRIGDELGMYPRVFPEAHAHDKDFEDEWYIEPDSTVGGNSDRDYDAELTSPIFREYDSFMDELKMVLDWIGQEPENWMFTNGTTGLHINIGPPTTFDPLKFIVFSGEGYLARLFPRSDSHSTRPLIPAITSQTQFKQNFDQYVAALIKSMSKLNDKMFLINFLPWFEKAKRKRANGGYVEVRAIGGVGYEKRFNEIKSHVDRLVTLFSIASDPAMYRREYMTKVYRYFVGPEDQTTQTVTMAARKLMDFLRAINAKPDIVSKWISDGRVIATPRMLIELLMNLRWAKRENYKWGIEMPSTTLKLVCREIALTSGGIDQTIAALPRYVKDDNADDVTLVRDQLQKAL